MEADDYLDSYLSDILPTLGLDVEAYAPYVTSFVSPEPIYHYEIIFVSHWIDAFLFAFIR